MHRRSFLQLVGVAAAAPIFVQPSLALAAEGSKVVSFAESLGVKLFPAQKLILKLMAGEKPSNILSPIESENIRIRSVCDTHFKYLTEVEYLNHLQWLGHYNGGTDPHHMIVHMGRRGGMSMLGNIRSLYDIHLMGENQEQGRVVRVDVNKDICGMRFDDITRILASNQKQELTKAIVRNTQASITFSGDRRLQYKTEISKGVRGLLVKSAIFDNAGLYNTDAVNRMAWSWMKSRVLVLTTGNIQNRHFHETWRRWMDMKIPIVLRVSSFTANPTLWECRHLVRGLEDVGA